MHRFLVTNSPHRVLAQEKWCKVNECHDAFWLDENILSIFLP